MKAVIANLGFILQTCGIIILIAVVPAFVYNEQKSIIALFITSAAFLVSGFVMNTLSERKELDFRSSCTLLLLAFLILGIFGSIPYLYTNIFANSDVPGKIINSIFESVSGFTTTGLTLVNNPDALPRSIIFYRALSQWIGGISIVFIGLIFFNSGRSLDNIGKAIGLGKITSTLKTSYISVLVIYASYSAIFIGIFYALGIHNWINNISLVFSTISTGGFSPVTNYSSLVVFPNSLVVAVLMIIGGASFMVSYRLFTGKFKKSIDFEFVAFISFIGIFAVLFWLITSRGDFSRAFFQIASASSTTGSTLIDTNHLAIDAKTLLVVIMFIGGCNYSTAGGVKIISVLVFLKSIPWAIKGAISGKLDKFYFRGKETKYLDLYSNAMTFVLIIGMLIIFAFVFTLYGIPLVDSIFELISAFSTTGLSVGVTSLSLPAILKILLIITMIVGRIGIVIFLLSLVPTTREVKIAPVKD